MVPEMGDIEASKSLGWGWKKLLFGGVNDVLSAHPHASGWFCQTGI